MSTPDLAAALAAWETALGPEAVLREPAQLAPYERNVGGLSRRIPAVLRPTSTEQVVAIVQAANAHRVPLYPFSTGKNWGMGSRLPVQDGNVVVDLSGMKRIRELNAPHHYAVVEPGVTQAMLYDEIRDRQLPLMLNVIGSGKDTSLLGNALDRGVGYFALRADSLSGLEVVLGNGTVVRTGFGHYPTARTTHLHKFGVGPYLDGLFCQSNYGIVTAAGVDLIPLPEASMTMIAGIDDEGKLEALVDCLAGLHRLHIVRTIVHIANRPRTEISIAPVIADYLVRHEGMSPADARAATGGILTAGGFGPWSAVAGIMGTPDQLALARREIKRHLSGVARVTFLNAGKLAFLRSLAAKLSFIPAFKTRLVLAHAIEPFFGLTQGIPSDAALGSVYWPLEIDPPDDPTQPDDSRAGLLYTLPYIPLSGEAAARATGLAREIFGARGFTPYITYNIADAKSMESVINLAFHREDADETARAHDAVGQLEEAFIREGYIPYRVGIQSISRLVDADDTFWQTASRIKQALDPNGIIAPGRYSL